MKLLTKLYMKWENTKTFCEFEMGTYISATLGW